MSIEDKNNICTILDFEFMTEEPQTLWPMMGSALHGIMGRQLHRMFCIRTDPVCSECDINCVYCQVFNRRDSKNRNNTLPNLYTIYHRGTEAPSTKLRFRISIFGESVAHKDSIIEAVSTGCLAGLTNRRVPYRLTALTENKCKVFSNNPEPAKEVTLQFDTPLQIRISVAGKKTVSWTPPSFSMVMKCIFLRLDELGIIAVSPDLENTLMERAKTITEVQNSLRKYSLERLSVEKYVRRSLSGLHGEITFRGDLDEFMPFLRAGEILHIGKACTMGNGHYMVLHSLHRPGTVAGTDIRDYSDATIDSIKLSREEESTAD